MDDLTNHSSGWLIAPAQFKRYVLIGGEPVKYKNLMLLGSGIKSCLEKKLIGPALILIYSAIDTTGWLDSPEKEATRESFRRWVDDYILKAKPIGCTSIDLYAARCGLLHTFSPDSRLSSEGKARRIYYAWGTANVQDLQRTIDLTNKSTEYVAVHVNDLYEGWQLGLLRFTQDLENDPARKSGVYKKAAMFFSELGLETVHNALTKLDKSSTP